MSSIRSTLFCVFVVLILKYSESATPQAYRRDPGHPQWHHSAFQEVRDSVRSDVHRMLHSRAEVYLLFNNLLLLFHASIVSPFSNQVEWTAWFWFWLVIVITEYTLMDWLCRIIYILFYPSKFHVSSSVRLILADFLWINGLKWSVLMQSLCYMHIETFPRPLYLACGGLSTEFDGHRECEILSL